MGGKKDEEGSELPLRAKRGSLRKGSNRKMRMETLSHSLKGRGGASSQYPLISLKGKKDQRRGRSAMVGDAGSVGWTTSLRVERRNRDRSVPVKRHWVPYTHICKREAEEGGEKREPRGSILCAASYTNEIKRKRKSQRGKD